MSKPKAAVLLSCYNGEKYLREQIDSILAQTYPELTIYAHDDASTDGTAAILSEYEGERLRLVSPGEHFGYPRCFYALLEQASDAEYYAFSDQDDVWMPQKIERAIGMMEKKGGSKQPLMCFCASEKCSADLTVRSVRSAPDFMGLPAYPLLASTAPGFAMVISRALRDLIAARPVQQHHDWLVCRAAYYLGEILYDPTPLARHREHDASFTIASRTSGLSKDQARDKTWAAFRADNAEFLRAYGDLLSPAQQKQLHTFSAASKWSRALYPRRLRKGLGSELRLRKTFLREK